MDKKEIILMYRSLHLSSRILFLILLCVFVFTSASLESAGAMTAPAAKQNSPTCDDNCRIKLTNDVFLQCIKQKGIALTVSISPMLLFKNLAARVLAGGISAVGLTAVVVLQCSLTARSALEQSLGQMPGDDDMYLLRTQTDPNFSLYAAKPRCKPAFDDAPFQRPCPTEAFCQNTLGIGLIPGTLLIFSRHAIYCFQSSGRRAPTPYKVSGISLNSGLLPMGSGYGGQAYSGKWVCRSVDHCDLDNVGNKDAALITAPYQNGIWTGLTQGAAKIIPHPGIPLDKGTNVPFLGPNPLYMSVQAIRYQIEITQTRYPNGSSALPSDTDIVQSDTGDEDVFGSDTVAINTAVENGEDDLLAFDGLVVDQESEFPTD